MQEWLGENPAHGVLIFAADARSARCVAEDLRLQPHRWRFVHHVDQIWGLSPLNIGTITIPRFAEKNPGGFEALKALHTMAKVYDVQVPSFDPNKR